MFAKFSICNDFYKVGRGKLYFALSNCIFFMYTNIKYTHLFNDNLKTVHNFSKEIKYLQDISFLYINEIRMNR